MITTQAAQDFLGANFAEWILDLNITITQMSANGATLEIPIHPHIERVGGIVSGQALSSLADTAMVFACISGPKSRSLLCTLRCHETPLDVHSSYCHALTP